MSNTNVRGKQLRILFATALAGSALASLAALGGVGFAKGSISAAQYQYGKDKVVICHKGKTLKVAKPSLKGHLKHKDTLGPCATDARKGKQKGKGKPEQKPAKPSKPSDDSKKSDDDSTEAAASKKSDDSKSAPGKSEDRGKSGDAPGRSGEAPGKPADTPGKGKGK